MTPTPQPSAELTDKHFTDWEGEVFGYGYGTGEEPIMRCLHFFFSSLEDGRTYNYEVLEKELGAAATWLLINTLCHARIIKYGTSPRFGWIDHHDAVNALRDYVTAHTPEQLYEILMHDEKYIPCYSSHCNCEADGKEPCRNPLFRTATDN